MAVPFPVLAPIYQYCPFLDPTSGNFPFGTRYPNRQSAITGTGRDSFRTISGTGLCRFRQGDSLGPVPKLGSMCVVPFPVRGSASSGTVIHWAPYRNWTLCTWSHFQYGALPVPVRSFTGSRTETGLYAQWVRPFVGLWFNGNGVMDDNVDGDGDGATANDDDDNGEGRRCDGRRKRRDGAKGDDLGDDGDGATGDDDDDDGDGTTGCDNEYEWMVAMERRPTTMAAA